MTAFWRRRRTETDRRADRPDERADPLAADSRPVIASTAATPGSAASSHPQPEAPLSTPDRTHHVATVTHEGRFWDVYVEVMPQASPRDPVRGRLMFSAADGPEPVHTAPIFVEPSVDLIVERARELGPHRLIALLRSCLP